MEVALILLGFGVMALIQVPAMVKKKWWSDLLVYSVIFLFALITAVSYSLNWPIVSPIKYLTFIMQTVYQFLGYQVPPH